jgi:hypothetical protein
MTIAQKLAGYSLGAADLSRHAMGNQKELLHKECVRAALTISPGHPSGDMLSKTDPLPPEWRPCDHAAGPETA